MSSLTSTGNKAGRPSSDQMFGLLELSSQCETISVSAGRKLLCGFLLDPGQYSAHNKVDIIYVILPSASHRSTLHWFTSMKHHKDIPPSWLAEQYFLILLIIILPQWGPPASYSWLVRPTCSDFMFHTYLICALMQQKCVLINNWNFLDKQIWGGL